jgi:hypothetical protein
MKVKPYKQFYLLRKEDVSGVSGEGIIAQGVILHSGQVVMEWLTANGSIAIYKSIDEIQVLHAHGGKTEVVYIK